MTVVAVGKEEEVVKVVVCDGGGHCDVDGGINPKDRNKCTFDARIRNKELSNDDGG